METAREIAEKVANEIKILRAEIVELTKGIKDTMQKLMVMGSLSRCTTMQQHNDLKNLVKSYLL